MTPKSLVHLFWQELDFKKTSEQVLTEALEYARRKFGQPVTVVRVPLSFPELNGKTPAGVTIERHGDVRPTYLWLQVPETPQAEQAAEAEPA
jgi:hypothetical protein